MSTPAGQSGSTSSPAASAAALSSKAPVTGSLSALQHTGLPPSLLKWRPRLPSRNWSIFLTVVGGTAYLYWDDRRKCEQIKQEYIDKVKHLAEVPIGSLDYPRKVTVYAGKWPEDDDWERGLQYFKRYLKPILAAAAVDYDLVQTGQYGSVTRHVQDKILARRRQGLGIEPVPASPLSGAPGQLSTEEKIQREVEGGVVIVGRHTLKEYMEGLRRGWMMGVSKVDREKEVEERCRDDGVFDEKKEELLDGSSGAEGAEEAQAPVAPSPTPAGPSAMLGAIGHMRRPTNPAFLANQAHQPAQVDPETLITPEMHLPPSLLPRQPAMLLVPWLNHLGFKQIPYMFIGLFTESKKYREGGEAALRLVLGGERDFEGDGQGELAAAWPSDMPAQASSSGAETDLDFDADVERYYKKDFDKTLDKIAKARENYYEVLRPKIQASRELAAGTREPTKDELAKPPPSELELRAERAKRELTWRNQEEGFEIVKRGSKVVWDPRWAGWLKVYTDPEEVMN